ncbi:hypothetical protein BB558_001086 [Smittium angustum]|uniref:Uncharacterized protein n=1 Tax=Smittium angustum TaxID=133377 RepID=A0A2U1JCM3_SMIAN|nr:hypothetical protein BB558_001086 [Smittium angustum]
MLNETARKVIKDGVELLRQEAEYQNQPKIAIRSQKYISLINQFNMKYQNLTDRRQKNEDELSSENQNVQFTENFENELKLLEEECKNIFFKELFIFFSYCLQPSHSPSICIVAAVISHQFLDSPIINHIFSEPVFPYISNNSLYFSDTLATETDFETINNSESSLVLNENIQNDENNDSQTPSSVYYNKPLQTASLNKKNRLDQINVVVKSTKIIYELLDAPFRTENKLWIDVYIEILTNLYKGSSTSERLQSQIAKTLKQIVETAHKYNHFETSIISYCPSYPNANSTDFSKQASYQICGMSLVLVVQTLGNMFVYSESHRVRELAIKSIQRLMNFYSQAVIATTNQHALQFSKNTAVKKSETQDDDKRCFVVQNAYMFLIQLIGWCYKPLADSNVPYAKEGLKSVLSGNILINSFIIDKDKFANKNEFYIEETNNIHEYVQPLWLLCSFLKMCVETKTSDYSTQKTNSLKDTNKNNNLKFDNIQKEPKNESYKKNSNEKKNVQTFTNISLAENQHENEKITTKSDKESCINPESVNNFSLEVRIFEAIKRLIPNLVVGYGSTVYPEIFECAQELFEIVCEEPMWSEISLYNTFDLVYLSKILIRIKPFLKSSINEIPQNQTRRSSFGNLITLGFSFKKSETVKTPIPTNKSTWDDRIKACQVLAIDQLGRLQNKTKLFIKLHNPLKPNTLLSNDNGHPAIIVRIIDALSNQTKNGLGLFSENHLLNRKQKEVDRVMESFEKNSFSDNIRYAKHLAKSYAQHILTMVEDEDYAEYQRTITIKAVECLSNIMFASKRLVGTEITGFLENFHYSALKPTNMDRNINDSGKFIETSQIDLQNSKLLNGHNILSTDTKDLNEKTKIKPKTDCLRTSEHCNKNFIHGYSNDYKNISNKHINNLGIEKCFTDLVLDIFSKISCSAKKIDIEHLLINFSKVYAKKKKLNFLSCYVTGYSLLMFSNIVYEDLDTLKNDEIWNLYKIFAHLSTEYMTNTNNISIYKESYKSSMIDDHPKDGIEYFTKLHKHFLVSTKSVNVYKRLLYNQYQNESIKPEKINSLVYKSGLSQTWPTIIASVSQMFESVDTLDCNEVYTNLKGNKVVASLVSNLKKGTINEKKESTSTDFSEQETELSQRDTRNIQKPLVNNSDQCPSKKLIILMLQIIKDCVYISCREKLDVSLSALLTTVVQMLGLKRNICQEKWKSRQAANVLMQLAHENTQYLESNEWEVILETISQFYFRHYYAIQQELKISDNVYLKSAYENENSVSSISKYQKLNNNIFRDTEPEDLSPKYTNSFYRKGTSEYLGDKNDSSSRSENEYELSTQNRSRTIRSNKGHVDMSPNLDDNIKLLTYQNELRQFQQNYKKKDTDQTVLNKEYGGEDFNEENTKNKLVVQKNLMNSIVLFLAETEKKMCELLDQPIPTVVEFLRSVSKIAVLEAQSHERQKTLNADDLRPIIRTYDQSTMFYYVEIENIFYSQEYTKSRSREKLNLYAIDQDKIYQELDSKTVSQEARARASSRKAAESSFERQKYASSYGIGSTKSIVAKTQTQFNTNTVPKPMVCTRLLFTFIDLVISRKPILGEFLQVFEVIAPSLVEIVTCSPPKQVYNMHTTETSNDKKYNAYLGFYGSNTFSKITSVKIRAVELLNRLIFYFLRETKATGTTFVLDSEIVHLTSYLKQIALKTNDLHVQTGKQNESINYKDKSVVSSTWIQNQALHKAQVIEKRKTENKLVKYEKLDNMAYCRSSIFSLISRNVYTALEIVYKVSMIPRVLETSLNELTVCASIITTSVVYTKPQAGILSTFPSLLRNTFESNSRNSHEDMNIVGKNKRNSSANDNNWREKADVAINEASTQSLDDASFGISQVILSIWQSVEKQCMINYKEKHKENGNDIPLYPLFCELVKIIPFLPEDLILDNSYCELVFEENEEMIYTKIKKMEMEKRYTLNSSLNQKEHDFPMWNSFEYIRKKLFDMYFESLENLIQSNEIDCCQLFLDSNTEIYKISQRLSMLPETFRNLSALLEPWEAITLSWVELFESNIGIILKNSTKTVEVFKAMLDVCIGYMSSPHEQMYLVGIESFESLIQGLNSYNEKQISNNLSVEAYTPVPADIWVHFTCAFESVVLGKCFWGSNSIETLNKIESDSIGSSKTTEFNIDGIYSQSVKNLQVLIKRPSFKADLKQRCSVLMEIARFIRKICVEEDSQIFKTLHRSGLQTLLRRWFRLLAVIQSFSRAANMLTRRNKDILNRGVERSHNTTYSYNGFPESELFEEVEIAIHLESVSSFTFLESAFILYKHTGDGSLPEAQKKKVSKTNRISEYGSTAWLGRALLEVIQFVLETYSYKSCISEVDEVVVQYSEENQHFSDCDNYDSKKLFKQDGQGINRKSTDSLNIHIKKRFSNERSETDESEMDDIQNINNLGKDKSVFSDKVIEIQEGSSSEVLANYKSPKNSNTIKTSLVPNDFNSGCLTNPNENGIDFKIGRYSGLPVPSLARLIIKILSELLTLFENKKSIQNPVCGANHLDLQDYEIKEKGTKNNGYSNSFPEASRVSWNFLKSSVPLLVTYVADVIANTEHPDIRKLGAMFIKSAALDQTIAL